MKAYIGSFNYTGSEGIHICEYDEKDGVLTYQGTIARDVNAGSVTVYNNWLFSTDETEKGDICIYRLDPSDGMPVFCRRLDTLAVNPSFITIDNSETYALVTHFSVGTPVKVVTRENGHFKTRLIANDSATNLYALDPDQGIGELLDVGLHENGSYSMTMIHKAYKSETSDIFAENDLGCNCIYFFRIIDGKLRYLTSFVTGEGDEGPRHGVFHPSGNWLYINYEHKNRISCLDIHDLNAISIYKEYSLLKDDVELEKEDNQSEILISRNGCTLYNFMRGKGVGYVFRINQDDGDLKLIQCVELPGKDPRGAVISPDDRHLLIAEHTDGVVFTLDIAVDGTLSFSGKECRIAHPASIAFYK